MACGQFSIQEQEYGKTSGGEIVKEFTLRNAKGIEVKFLTFGGAITSLLIPDNKGHFENVVLGFSTLEQYENDPGPRPYFGALIGRYGNRIAGKFSLEGKSYNLSLNENSNCLHGGKIGFDKRVWQAEILPQDDQQVSVSLSLLSEDGDQGFPGNLSVRVIYSLNNNDEFTIHYQAQTDKTTVVNLTNHSYINLSGEGNGSIENHSLQLFCSHYTPVDQNMIPTGEIAPVANTPMDFRASTHIGTNIRDNFEQLYRAIGYDHNWVVDGKVSKEVRPAAKLVHAASGRKLDLYTTLPGMQVYTGNALKGNLKGYSGKAYRQCEGIAFEPQYYPDSPNQPNFPSTILKPGEVYDQKTVYHFSVVE
ncbi:aldose epimerase family protein [Commensalibacter papalotli (ex Botero et al. 2024)]|uniref:Aldose 1-epimerase n=1 Tax=Commensalibacter papalotli (ex Botero et al. 2024) TaxID=2972766 RepID=A0ABM9HIV0_9PROT|nr:aldose epimerase family protein [Commensalibacter papalotli (ex Botero et al. 2024)]CAI3926093.1 Galactose mutarotase or related enzyme (GalM) (PDB:1LUR) [Commensalibacter papalotli (ex Botero et al. 2024)]